MVEVPTLEIFESLRKTVVEIQEKLESLPNPIEITPEEKEAISTVIALIQRIVTT